MLNRSLVSWAVVVVVVVAMVVVLRRLQGRRHISVRVLPTPGAFAEDRSRMNRRARQELRIRMDEGAWAGEK